MELPTEDNHLYFDDQRIYAKDLGHVFWFMIRATDKDTFLSKGLELGLLQYTEPEQPEVLDEEGNIVREYVPASGDVVSVRGVTVTHIGYYATTKGEYDLEGNVLVEPVYDSRWHVNLWINPNVVKDQSWVEWAKEWSSLGTPSDPMKEEESVLYEGIELIDPATVSSPSNQLL